MSASSCHPRDVVRPRGGPCPAPPRLAARRPSPRRLPAWAAWRRSLSSRLDLRAPRRRQARGRARNLTVRAADGESTVTERVSTDTVMIDPVVGAKRFSNYFWAGVVTTGATGFLITGASAYFQHNLLWFLDASEIKFFPQGLVMSFYGVAGSLLATYLWCVPPRPDPPPVVGRCVAPKSAVDTSLAFFFTRRSTTLVSRNSSRTRSSLPVHSHRLTINWDVGAGYNEFNKEEGIMRIFRYGFPGKNRRINLVSNLADVQAVRVDWISDGVNPRRVVYVRCKGKSDILHPHRSAPDPRGGGEAGGGPRRSSAFPIEGL